MNDQIKGNLLIIGGKEDKVGDCRILRRFIELAGGRSAHIAVITTATEKPHEVGDEYRQLFLELGAESASILYMANREAANDRHQIAEIENASGIYFTGGDQLRITSILGGSLADRAIRHVIKKNVIVAGTSAGASVMSDTMIVEGTSSDTPKKSTIGMAHGMGLLENVVIDQHFAQRGRINRLLAAVAQNPYVLGMGIDEDTAILVSPDGRCEVIGSQTVTIVDGKLIGFSNISETSHHEPLALSNVIIHILPQGYGYDIKRRHPLNWGQLYANSYDKRD